MFFSNFLSRIFDAFTPPPPPPPPAPTIAEIVTQQVTDAGQFETLAAALTITQDAGLNGLLNAAADPNSDITVFAPTDEAFRATAADLGIDLAGLADGEEVALALVTALDGLTGGNGAATVSEILK